METIGQRALRRFLLLATSLVMGLSLGVYGFLEGGLTASALGLVLLLLMTAFLLGISQILRATSREIHGHLEPSPRLKGSVEEGGISAGLAAAQAGSEYARRQRYAGEMLPARNELSFQLQPD